jgi:hypothetical protein
MLVTAGEALKLAPRPDALVAAVAVLVERHGGDVAVAGGGG